MATRDKIPSNDSDLNLAMVYASATPLLLLDGACKVIAASASFYEAFEIDPATSKGRLLFDLGEGEWGLPQLRTLMGATLSGDATIEAYETELLRPDEPSRCVVLNVRKLAYGDGENVRLLVAVNDITRARALEKAGRELAHDNAVLSQEVRHRVANSLQIIASVMMLNARRTSSEELRGHLRDARNRVLSIADLQNQLALASSEAVDMHAYLTKLAETIGASMIPDPKALVLRVVSPNTRVDAEVSVSLGLIVTELVINALKHGFPDGAGGEIVVTYEQDDTDWSLSVADNGVGMPANRSDAMAGLGTSIIQALARQLGAEVAVTVLHPGTRVSIIHGATAGAEVSRLESRRAV
jgi:two-component sensor histidine kinase